MVVVEDEVDNDSVGSLTVEDVAEPTVVVIDVPAVPPQAANISATTPSAIRRLMPPGYGRGPRTRRIRDTHRRHLPETRQQVTHLHCRRPPAGSPRELLNWRLSLDCLRQGAPLH